MELPFAALQQLCSPVLDRSERLPAAQRDALNVAFGLLPGRLLIRSWSDWRPSACCPRRRRSDRSCASSMTRSGSIMRRRARSRSWPAACWQRRSRSCSPLVSRAARSPDCRSLRVEPLGHRDARTLLESVLPARLDEHVLDRIVLETRGNPLALLELPRGLTPAQLAGGFGLPPAVPLSASIEESFTRRLARLPGDARRWLLIAAADPTGDPALVWQAARRARDPRVRRRHASKRTTCWQLGVRVVFRHPLVRSAVYRSAGLGERRAIHRALADATDPQDRSGSPRVAPGAGSIDARRGRRRGARAFRGTSAGARRIGRRRCLPRARRRAHA